MIIGVTGTIGSGKSRVCAALADLLSASVVSADEICRDLLLVGARGWMEMRNVFSSTFFLSDGQVDRPRLRKAIFSDNSLRRQLDDILHPLVRAELQRAALDAHQKKAYLLAEVPLLFETGWQGDFDWTVLVIADEESCIRRIVLRDLVSEEEARQAIAAQMPLQEKRRLADSVIDNSLSFAETLEQVRILSQRLQKDSLFITNRK